MWYMITVLGIIFLLLPFILIFCFEDKLKAFLYVFLSEIFLILLLSILSQYFYLFNYYFIFGINLIVFSLLFIFFINRKNKIWQFKLNWLLIFSLVIIFFELFSLHHFYNGPINTINGLVNVQNYSYPYPYFSDEWIGVSLTSYSIKSHGLPLVNPLYKNYFFANPMFSFFSITSYFFLLLNINPIINYNLFALINGLLICLLLYFLLRVNKVSVFSSIFSILCIPLITNGSNLPGVWYFLPFNFSLIFLIISLISVALKDKIMYLFSLFLSLICTTFISI